MVHVHLDFGCRVLGLPQLPEQTLEALPIGRRVRLLIRLPQHDREVRQEPGNVSLLDTLVCIPEEERGFLVFYFAQVVDSLVDRLVVLLLRVAGRPGIGRRLQDHAGEDNADEYDGRGHDDQPQSPLLLGLDRLQSRIPCGARGALLLGPLGDNLDFAARIRILQKPLPVPLHELWPHVRRLRLVLDRGELLVDRCVVVADRLVFHVFTLFDELLRPSFGPLVVSLHLLVAIDQHIARPARQVLTPGVSGRLESHLEFPADPDEIAVVQDRDLDPVAVDEDAVAAAQVLDRDLVAVNIELSVLARDGLGGDDQLAGLGPSKGPRPLPQSEGLLLSVYVYYQSHLRCLSRKSRII